MAYWSQEIDSVELSEILSKAGRIQNLLIIKFAQLTK